LDPAHLALLVLTGLVAGVINTLAGGGSLLSLPLLVFLGLPGDIANGTNRLGILVQSIAALHQLRRDGLHGIRDSRPVLLPICSGALLGASGIAQLPAEQFERLFGVLMLVLLVPTLRGVRSIGSPQVAPRPWHPITHFAVFFGIGVYGGAIQAGVGLLVLFALARSGMDLVRANTVKIAVVATLTAVAIPVFVLEGQVEWRTAAALMLGFGLGGVLGAKLAVLGGERLIRPLVVVAVVALAGHMLDWY
jgi:uncharacterized membrane protein YfcA